MNLVAEPPHQFLPAIGKLLRLRILINLNSFRHARTRNKVGMIILLVAVLVTAGVILLLSWLLLGFLRSPELVQYTGIDARPFLAAVPVLILTGMFLAILLTSFGVLLQALYLSGDMDFLLSTPVPIRAVFVTKLLQAVLPNFALLALFGLPVLYGLGISSGYNLLYFPLVLLIMIALTLAAAGISALFVMLVARIFPPRRIAEILGFLTATLGLICSQTGNFFQFTQRNQTISSGQTSGMFALMTQLNTSWLPLNWAGRGLVDLGEGRWLSGILLIGLTLGLTAAAFWFALVTSERWYYTGWASMQVITQKKKTARRLPQVTIPKTARVSHLDRLIPRPVIGILQKDFLVLRRDLRNLSQLVTPLILGVIYALTFFRVGTDLHSGPVKDFLGISIHSLLTYGNVGISLFVSWMLLGRLAGMGFAQEGKNYWILKASPVRNVHLLAAKFLVAYLPALGLGWLFLAGISILQGVSFVDFSYNLVAVAICLAGLTGILLAFGVAGANFNWEDPRRMNAGLYGCLGTLVTFLILPLSFGLFMGPLWVTAALHWPQFYGYLVGLLLGISVGGVSTFLPLWLIRGRVERLNES